MLNLNYAAGFRATSRICTLWPFCPGTRRYRLIEHGLEIRPDQPVGELAMLAPEKRRRATLECDDGDAPSMTFEQVERSSPIKNRLRLSISCAWRRRGYSTISATSKAGC